MLQKKADKAAKSAMRFLVTPIPFKPIALENHSMQPLSQSITRKLRSTTLQHSILVQREKQNRKVTSNRRAPQSTQRIECEANPVILRPKGQKRMSRDIAVESEESHLAEPTRKVALLHNELNQFSSGESEGELIHIQTQELRAISQLENPLLAMNDLEA